MQLVANLKPPNANNIEINKMDVIGIITFFFIIFFLFSHTQPHGMKRPCRIVSCHEVGSSVAVKLVLIYKPSQKSLLAQYHCWR